MYKDWKPIAALMRQQIFDADRRHDNFIKDIADFLLIEDMVLDYNLAVECGSFSEEER